MRIEPTQDDRLAAAALVAAWARADFTGATAILRSVTPENALGAVLDYFTGLLADTGRDPDEWAAGARTALGDG